MNELRSFVELVAEMRNKQREYFVNRTYNSLQKAKMLERRVDNTISELRRYMYSSAPKQLSLDFPTE